MSPFQKLFALLLLNIAIVVTGTVLAYFYAPELLASR